MARIPSGRFAPNDVNAQLGLLAGMPGTWKGHGYNLIARPDFHDKTDLYLQLNHTRETLVFDAIGASIPNRGFGQDDIELFGMTYLQKIADAGHDGALHIEPGIWVTQPNTDFPTETVPPPSQLVARMATIPHGNSVLAQGIAERFVGTPVLTVPGATYAFSRFPSFNSTPFGVPPTAPGIVVNAAGSSEKLTAEAIAAPPFPAYDLSIPAAPAPLPPDLAAIFNVNARTPFDTVPAEPDIADTPENQALVNDPITLLQNDIRSLVDQGYTFEGVVLNVATQAQISFLDVPNANPAAHPAPPVSTVNVPQFNGGTENILFLTGQNVAVGGAQQPVENAQTALVYATFWLETATNATTGHSFQQLQYAQMVVLNFPIFHLLNPPETNPPTAPTYVNLGWPHITVGTLRKSFG
jgi:hypothetical protein